jgi:hypothetical protein
MFKIVLNILSDELFDACNNYSNTAIEDKSKLITNSLWDAEVVNRSTEVFISQLNSENILYEKITDEIKKHIPFRYKTCKISFFFWTKNSYIPWHYDLNRSGAVTIYLNDDWHMNDGGLYLYKNGDIINAVVPEKNLAVISDYKVFHGTSCVVENKIRRTIQIFLV